MGEYQETCPYCGNKFNMTESINHSLCSEFYFYLLSEKIAKMRQQLEICLEIQKKQKDPK
jgi:hypothetical protein